MQPQPMDVDVDNEIISVYSTQPEPEQDMEFETEDSFMRSSETNETSQVPAECEASRKRIARKGTSAKKARNDKTQSELERFPESY